MTHLWGIVTVADIIMNIYNGSLPANESIEGIIILQLSLAIMMIDFSCLEENGIGRI